MTKDEIKTLIAEKISGQGNQVDSGGALDAILNAIVDAIPEGGGNGALVWNVERDGVSLTNEEINTLSEALVVSRSDGSYPPIPLVTASAIDSSVAAQIQSNALRLGLGGDGDVMRLWGDAIYGVEEGQLKSFNGYALYMDLNDGREYMIWIEY